jgi:hypothetical protein
MRIEGDYVEIILVFMVVATLVYFFKFKKNKPGAKDIPNVIKYTAMALAKDPQNPFITMNGVLFSHVEMYVKNNRNVHILEQDLETLVFTASIDSVNYKVLAKKFIYDQLWIGAKILNKV